MTSVFASDQLSGHANTAASLAYAALQNVGDTKYPCDVAHVLLLSLESERRRSGNHTQSGHLRERVDNLFRQPVPEGFVLSLSTEIGERQYGYRSTSISYQGSFLERSSYL